MIDEPLEDVELFIRRQTGFHRFRREFREDVAEAASNFNIQLPQGDERRGFTWRILSLFVLGA
jgi:hypothetical protein